MQLFLQENYGLGGLTLTDLMTSGVFEPVEILAPFDSLLVNRFWSNFLARNSSKAGCRLYNQTHNNIYSRYYIDWLTPNSNFLVDLKSDNSRYSLSRRQFSCWNRRYSLTVGNYTVAEGYGLTIGRYDYRPSAGFVDNPEFDFVYPANSLYNGLKLAGSADKSTNTIYFSDKIYGDVRKRFIGDGFKYVTEIIDLGAVVGYNYLKLADTHNQKLATGVNWRIHDESFEIEGEYTVVNKSGGIYLSGIRRVDSMNIKAEFWHYANHFENYNCSGAAAADYYSFYSQGSEIGFKTSQAGETGAAISYAKTHWSAGYQVWHQSSESKTTSLVTMRMAYPIVDSLMGYIQANYADKRSSGYSWLKTGIRQNLLPILENAGVKLHYQNDRFLHDLSYAFIDLTRSLTKYIDISISLRSRFDGHQHWLFTEKAYFSNSIRIDAEIAISDGARVNIAIEKLL